RALTGYAMMRGGEVTGYCYYVCEDGKGLIGDLFVRPSPRQGEDESLLLSAVLDSVWRTPGIHRVAGQLMMLRNPLQRIVPYPRRFKAYPRRFYELDLTQIGSLLRRPEGGEGNDLVILPWSESRQDESAALIAESYLGHIDSEINDQYRSAS